MNSLRLYMRLKLPKINNLSLGNRGVPSPQRRVPRKKDIKPSAEAKSLAGANFRLS
jgi:hypothetical protein